MSFEQLEKSPRHGAPVELYRFDTGGGIILGYTDAETDIVYAGDTYDAVPVARDGIQLTGTLDQAEIEVSLPRTAALVDLFRVFPPSYVVWLTIYHGHLSDRVASPEFLSIFTGRVINLKIIGLEARLTVVSAITSVRRPGLRRHYQRGCPLVLYGPVCRAAKVARLVTRVDSNTFNSVVGEPIGDLGAELNEFLGGTIEWETAVGRQEIRNVYGIGQVPNSTRIELVLSGPIETMPIDAVFSLYLGCDHVESVCQNRFNNMVNYGGQPWIPLKNPVGNITTYF